MDMEATTAKEKKNQVSIQWQHHRGRKEMHRDVQLNGREKVTTKPLHVSLLDL